MNELAFIAKDLTDEEWVSAGQVALEQYLAKVVAFEEFLSDREENA